MILAALVALVVQTHGGVVSVVPNLSDHDCAEAACVVAFDRNCEERDKLLAKYDTATIAIKFFLGNEHRANPTREYCMAEADAQINICEKSDGSYGYYPWHTDDEYGQSRDITKAECVK